MGSPYCYIVLGLGLLLLGIGVVDGIRVLLEPHLRFLLAISQLEKRLASRPILLPEWNLPKT